MKKILAVLLSGIVCCSFLTSCLDPRLTETTRSSEEQEFYDNYYVHNMNSKIDFRSDPEKVMSALDHFVNNPYLSDEDKAKFELAKEVYSQFPYSINISFSVNANSFEDKDITLNYFHFGYGTVGIYDGCDLEIQNRIGVLWLNDEIEEMYGFDDYALATAKYAEFCNTFPTVEEFRSFSCGCDWLKLVDGFDYSMSAPEDERSASNYHIIELLEDNYLAYNPKLLQNASKEKLFGWPNYDNMNELFRIYKKYGNQAFGKETDGVLVIDNYDEMYGELDKLIMEEFNLKPESFR